MTLFYVKRSEYWIKSRGYIYRSMLHCGNLSIDKAGSSVSQTEKVSAKEYLAKCKKAAVKGNVIAQNTLGFLYLNGQGVDRDYTEAVRWFEQAAQQEYREAQYNLAIMYNLGQGTQQDKVQGAHWMKRAADYAYAPAQNALADLYYKGEGVELDYVLAYVYWELAEKNGVKDIEHKKSEILKKMSLEDIENAKQGIEKVNKH